MNNKLRAILVEPLEAPRLVEIDNSLDALQEAVGGYIQVVYPYNDPVGIVCDDEGKLKQTMPNRVLRDDEGRVYDYICGNFLICGIGPDDFVSLDNKLAKKYMALMARDMVIGF